MANTETTHHTTETIDPFHILTNKYQPQTLINYSFVDERDQEKSTVLLANIDNLPAAQATEARQQLELKRKAFQEAEEIIIRIGGRGGRLGESVIGTGFVEAVFASLKSINHTQTRVSIVVDDVVKDLFDQETYRQLYGENVKIVQTSLSDSAETIAKVEEESPASKILYLDLHGGSGLAAPKAEVTVKELPDGREREITSLSPLFVASVGAYAVYYDQRYALWAQTQFGLPPRSVDINASQPTIHLNEKDYAKRGRLLQELGVENPNDPNELVVLCGFQSFLEIKEYGRWDEVMEILAQEAAQDYPGKKLNFIVLCGPNDEGQRASNTTTAFKERFKDFTGTNNNAKVTVAQLGLRDVAILANKNAAETSGQIPAVGMSNDSFLAHIMGASGIEVATAFLPEIYPPDVWGATRGHMTEIPIGYDPDILWEEFESRVGHTAIDQIPPQRLASTVRYVLMSAVQQNFIATNHPITTPDLETEEIKE